MTTRCFRATPRLALALIGNLVLLSWFRDLFLWGGLEREAWRFFRVTLVASFILVCAGPVVLRGKAPGKLAGSILCLLPLFCLLGEMERTAHGP
ncbi:MAG: hypothetical protein RIS76_1587 [Verrucomicrobiota bacterium]|jgi:hypothetical protein